jgi:MYXO-CTERM domain-containing protein
MGAAATFSNPSGIAVDAVGNVYVADLGSNVVRKITPGGAVTTLANVLKSSVFWYFLQPSGIAVDVAGNVYFTDQFDTIHKVTPSGDATTLAGTTGLQGSADGIGAAAQFNNPVGLAVDSSGNVFVADSGNFTIRRITPEGVVTTLAGTPGSFGSADGTGPAARFGNFGGLAIDPTGNLFVTDTTNSALRKITSRGLVTTLASTNGSALAVDGAENVYVAVNSTIQKITPAGAITTVAGTAGSYGSADGIGSAAQFNYPGGLAVDPAGNLYVADVLNSAIRKGVLAGPPVISAQPQSCSVIPGAGVQLSIGVSSAIAYTCQWSLNGSPVSGATGITLDIVSASASNAGDYTVVVTNAIGSVTSNKATLTVGSSTASSASSGGGGGGAPSAWFIGMISLLALAHRIQRRN